MVLRFWFLVNSILTVFFQICSTFFISILIFLRRLYLVTPTFIIEPVFISAYSVYVFCGKRTIPLSTQLYQQRYLFWLRGPDLNRFAQRLCLCFHSCGAQNRWSLLLVANDFDRCANKCSLHPPPAAVTFVAPETRRPSVQGQLNAEKTRHTKRCPEFLWLRGPDLNRRPPGYEPDELPGCSTPRYLVVLRLFSYYTTLFLKLQVFFESFLLFIYFTVFWRCFLSSLYSLGATFIHHL